MSVFSHRTPACTAILRDGAIAEIPVHLKAWGVHKPALIAGSSVRQTAFFRQIHDALPPQAHLPAGAQQLPHRAGPRVPATIGPWS